MSETEIRLDGRAIIVTGGGRGLGREQAGLLASRGAMVVVADNGSSLSGSEGEGGIAATVAAGISRAGGRAVAFDADLSDEAGAAGVIECCMEAFGRIDGIIHYASSLPRLTAPDQMASREVDLVMRVNPVAAAWMIRAAWPHMSAGQFGRIVLMPSAALYGARGNTAYAAAKSSYFGMIRCLALEGDQHNILVNGIMPAARTRMTERLAPPDFAEWFNNTMHPQHVANCGAYLLSEDCGQSGEVFAAGGGRIARVMLAESEGVTNASDSPEAVRDAMPEVMHREHFFYPKDLGERSFSVNAVLGYEGRLDISIRSD